jgi:hypothetical protein
MLSGLMEKGGEYSGGKIYDPGNGKTYNIPYITVFEKENQKITVADRKGVISDNAQLKDLNYYIGDYFSKIVDTDIDFVQISKTYNGNIED